jgi:uncharacterized protein
MAKVYFASARATKWRYDDSMPGKLERLLRVIGLANYFKPKEWVAVKTHFGSEGAHRIVRPVFLRKVVEGLTSIGAKPFVTDTVRIQGLDYIEVANHNGINHLSVGAPVVIADGLYGKDNLMVKAGEILGEIAVASLIHDVPAMVVCSHVKGHINAGYAGAIKNVAMGAVSSAHRDCGWKCGRGAMHTIGEGKLIWNNEKCEHCYQCTEICPLDALAFEEGNALKWMSDICWRCGRCVRVCQSEAITLPGDDERFIRSLAEASKAVLSTFEPQKVLYINFLTEIQPECDCMPVADVPVVQDKGILLSDDIVSIEQASIEKLLRSEPLPESAASREMMSNADILYSLHKKPYMLQIDEAERLGLGSREYELIEI